MNKKSNECTVCTVRMSMSAEDPIVQNKVSASIVQNKVLKLLLFKIKRRLLLFKIKKTTLFTTKENVTNRRVIHCYIYSSGNISTAYFFGQENMYSFAFNYIDILDNIRDSKFEHKAYIDYKLFYNCSRLK